MNVNCDVEPVHNPQGDAINVKESIQYLGAQLGADGRIDSEIAQKLGAAAQEFKALKRIWNHCNISSRFKFIVFTACVVQKLLYSLECSWLDKVLRTKLDGFYVRCLRQILKVSPSFISRVSNSYILQQFHTPVLSKILLKRQLHLYGRVARMPNDAVMRQSIFEPSSLSLKCEGRRRSGRPRNTWGRELSKIVAELKPPHLGTQSFLDHKVSFELAVKRYTASAS